MGGTWGSYTFGSHAWGGDPDLEFRYSIYKMIVSGLRKLDEAGSGNLEKFCEMLDRAWNDLIYSRGTELSTLFEIDNIDDKWLTHLAPLLGFTADLDLPANKSELRKILSLAVPFWDEKPTELSMVNYAIRMVTGNRFRANNYFDFRIQEDTTCLTEEMEDFDSNLIDFGHEYFTGNQFLPFFPLIPNILDLPSPGVFEDEHQFRYLLIENDLVYPQNNGLYIIDSCEVGQNYIYLNYRTPIPQSNVNYTPWKLLHYMDEYFTEIRLVDDGEGVLNVTDIQSSFVATEKIYGMTSGATAYMVSQIEVGTDSAISVRNIKGRFTAGETVNGDSSGDATVKDLDGVLNRELLGVLVEQTRPLSERIDIAYTDFLDQFLVPGDLDQWDVTGAVTVPSPGGYALIPNGAYVEYSPPVNLWIDQMLLFKLTAIDTVTEIWFEICNDNSPTIQITINYSTKDVKLLYNSVSVATVNLAYLKIGIQDTIRVEAEYNDPNYTIRIKVNGNLEINDTRSVGTGFDGGGISIYSYLGSCKLQAVEIATVPIDIIRVGPNP